jgi:hypothetical protein
MPEPCNCDQALALTAALRELASGQFSGRATDIARKALREWQDETTVTICRTQDITVTFNDSEGDITAMDEGGNRVHLTDDEVAAALDLKNAGADETGR